MKEHFLAQHPEFVAELGTSSEEFQKNFASAAITFLQTAFKQIKKRISTQKSSIMLMDGFLLRNNSSFSKIQELAKRFTNIISEGEQSALSNEISMLRLNAQDLRSKIQNTNYLEAWRSQQSNYPLLYKLVRSLQALPYSIVNIERTFSDLVVIKTCKRNRLSVANIEACLLV